MLFISYWELSEELNPKDVVEVAAELMEKKLWPVEGTKIIGWYVAPGEVPTWGITITKTETVEQVLKNIAVWTSAKPGIFKVNKISPAMTAEDAMRVVMEM